MSCHKNEDRLLSRRSLLKTMGLASLVLRPAPLRGSSFVFGLPAVFTSERSPFPFSDVRLTPHYPAKSPLEDVLRLVAPGSDEYVTERYAFEIESLLKQWSQALKTSVHDLSPLAKSLDPSLQASSLVPEKEIALRTGEGIESTRRRFATHLIPGGERFLEEIHTWLGQVSQVETAEFEIVGIEETASAPLTVQLDIRYDIVATRNDEQREERVGHWRTEWARDPSNAWKARKWEASEETISVAHAPAFI